MGSRAAPGGGGGGAISGYERRRAALILLPGSQLRAPDTGPKLPSCSLTSRGPHSAESPKSTDARLSCDPGPGRVPRAPSTPGARRASAPVRRLWAGGGRGRKRRPRSACAAAAGLPGHAPSLLSPPGHAPGPAFPPPFPLRPMEPGHRAAPADHAPSRLCPAPRFPSLRSSPQPDSRPLHPTHAGHWTPGPHSPPSHSHLHPHSPSGYPLTAGHPPGPATLPP